MTHLSSIYSMFCSKVEKEKKKNGKLLNTVYSRVHFVCNIFVGVLSLWRLYVDIFKLLMHDTAKWNLSVDCIRVAHEM